MLQSKVIEIDVSATIKPYEYKEGESLFVFANEIPSLKLWHDKCETLKKITGDGFIKPFFFCVFDDYSMQQSINCALKFQIAHKRKLIDGNYFAVHWLQNVNMLDPEIVKKTIARGILRSFNESADKYVMRKIA